VAEWTNEGFFNPSGPYILQLKINEDIRLKILDAITDREEMHVDLRFTGGKESDRLNDAIKNSIVDGNIGEVSKEWIKKHPENKIENTIEKLLCRYGERYYNRPCLSTITDVWYVVMKAGDFHLLHAHANHDDRVPKDTVKLSGAIYLKVPDNLPHPQGTINWVIGGPVSAPYDPLYQHSPEPGDVFLWPAWLMHMVYPFRSKQERIMISFNGAVKCI